MSDNGLPKQWAQMIDQSSVGCKRSGKHLVTEWTLLYEVEARREHKQYIIMCGLQTDALTDSNPQARFPDARNGQCLNAVLVSRLFLCYEIRSIRTLLLQKS